ncbi:putative entry exclusion protein TrbK-alt [Chelativorans sp. AA-79]|uniref:putative entry exclusion protein TrbK-alt n=1 Tax=Chelativorans sp. AA-79 TaxID=3028735 RepID=UPI0023F79D3B|nr:putative entry exclusion protein TrbK-alt [Chelativorans sp. AA-79]WEX11515.1 putative entry exclusion protein TrbK-alt [Chelativorans sp. AA-79]
MDGKMLARLGAVAFVAIAITATVIELSRKEERSEMAPAHPVQANAEDTLQAELFRCQSLGEAGPRDPACLRAWAESRRRFLTAGSPNRAADREQSRTRGGAPAQGSSAHEAHRREATPHTEDAE